MQGKASSEKKIVIFRTPVFLFDIYISKYIFHTLNIKSKTFEDAAPDAIIEDVYSETEPFRTPLNHLQRSHFRVSLPVKMLIGNSVFRFKLDSHAPIHLNPFSKTFNLPRLVQLVLIHFFFVGVPSPFPLILFFLFQYTFLLIPHGTWSSNSLLLLEKHKLFLKMFQHHLMSHGRVAGRRNTTEDDVYPTTRPAGLRPFPSAQVSESL